jgi:flagellar biosynthesis protein FlhF
MEYFVEQATTHREAEAKIRQKYGEQARIMHHRTVRLGGFLGMFSREGVEVTGYFSNEPRSRKTVPAPERNLQEEKKKLLEVMKGDGERTLETVLDEIRSLRESLVLGQSSEPEHPTIAAVRRVLGENDFSQLFTAQTIDRMRRELSVEQLEDQSSALEHVLGWIGDSIRLHVPRSSGRPEIFVLVGPTGVGKTTTIAKLAAMYGLDKGGTKPRDIRILTIDNYRIGARQQIETYGQIMGIPVSFVESAEEMRKYLALYQDADMIFIDTIGKSPRDFRRLAEMNELLAICGSRARVHLAVSATTKTADVGEIATQFEPFKYEAVVVTKLDETTRAGNIISVLSEKGKPISFVTDGQRVPQDIERATVLRLLTHLEGFGLTRGRLEQRFGTAPVRSA